MVHERNWRVSLCVQELCHPQDFLWILAATPGSQNTMGCPVLDRGLRFYLFLFFWLTWSTAALLGFQKNTGLTVLAFQHVYLTQLRDRNLSHTDLPVLVYPHFRLTQLKGSWLVRYTSLRKTWDDHVPALKVSWVLKKASLRKNSLINQEPRLVRSFPYYNVFKYLFMRWVFWPLIHSYEYPCSSQSFPSDRNAGVSSRTFTDKNISNSLT